MLRTVPTTLLLLASVAACSAKDDGSQFDPRPLDEQYPARITLSDAGEFYARPQIIIEPGAGGLASVRLQANATNFSKDPTTEAHREGRPDMDLSFGIPCDGSQIAALARGERVPFEGIGLQYGVPDRKIHRLVTGVALALNANHTVTLVIELAPGFTVLDPTAPPQTDPNLGTAESMTVTGQMPVACAAPDPRNDPAFPDAVITVDDPNFSTEFCRDALDEFGLRAIREAQL